MARNRRSPAVEARGARSRPGPVLGLDPLEVRSLLSTILVSSTADSGPGTLRQAVDSSVRGDTILFTPPTEDQPVALTNGPIRIRHSLTIQGLGPAHTVISGNGTGRVFNVFGRGVDVTLVDLTIQDGVATAQSPRQLAQGNRRTLNDRISDAKAIDAGGLANALTRKADAATATPTVSALAASLAAAPSLPVDPIARAQALGLGGIANALARRAQPAVRAVDAPASPTEPALPNTPGQGGVGNPAAAPTVATPAPGGQVTTSPTTVTYPAATQSPTVSPSRAVQASLPGLGQAVDHGTQALAGAKSLEASLVAARASSAALNTARPRSGSTALAHPALSASGLGAGVVQAAHAARTQGLATPGSALGGAIYVSGGNLTVINSVLANNQAIGASGGGNAGAGGRGGDAIGSATYTLGSGFRSAGNQFRTVSVHGGNGANGGGGGAGAVVPLISNSTVSLGGLASISPKTAFGTTSPAPRVLTKNHGSIGGGNGGNGGQGGDALGGGVFSMGHRVTLVGNLFMNSHATGGNGANGGGGGNGAVDVTINGTTSIAKYNVHGIRTGGGQGGNGGRGGNAFGGAVFNVGSHSSFLNNSFVDTSAVGGNGGNGGGGGGGAVNVDVTDTNASLLGGSGGLGSGGGLFNLG